MTISKTALTVGSLAFVGLFGGGIFLYSQAGTIVKGFLEKTGSQVLGVPVEIGSVYINLKDRSAAVKGLVIGNPEGFDKPYLMAVGHVGARLESVSKELLVIDAIEIRDTDVNFELTKQGSNVMTLKRGIDAKAARSPEQKAEDLADEAAQAEAHAAAMKVIINDLRVNEIGLHPSASFSDELSFEQDITVPPITLSDIGRRENGILAREAIAQVFDRVLKEINSSAAQQGLSPRALLDQLGGGVIDDVKDRLKSLF